MCRDAHASLLLEYYSALVMSTEQKFAVAHSRILLEAKRKAFTHCLENDLPFSGVIVTVMEILSIAARGSNFSANKIPPLIQVGYKTLVILW